MIEQAFAAFSPPIRLAAFLDGWPFGVAGVSFLPASSQVVAIAGTAVMLLVGVAVRRRLHGKSHLHIPHFERRVENLIESVPGMVWIAEAETLRTRFISRRTEAILGYPRSRWLSEPSFGIDHVHAADRARMLEAAKRCAAGGGPLECEYRMIAADGRVVWLRGIASLVREGEHACLQSVMLDVTSSREAAEALRRSEAQLRAIFDQSVVGVVIQDREGNILTENAAFWAMANGNGDMLRQLDDDFAALWSGATSHVEKELCHAPNRWCRVTASLVSGEGGARAVSVAIIEDISARKIAENEIRASHQMLGEFVALSTDWVWECDASARYTYASGRVRDVLGYEPAEVIGKTACDLSPPEEVQHTRDALLDLLQSTRSFSRVELTGQHRDGRLVDLEVSGQPMLDAHGALVGYRGVVHDVTEREMHRRERQRLATAIEHAAEVVIITDRDANIEYVNPAFEKVSGYTREEVRGKKPSFLREDEQKPEHLQDLWSELSAGRTWSGSFTNARRDGRPYDVDATISPIFDDHRSITGFVAVHRDVTEKLALLQQLRTAVEMERIGMLVSGVAHEVRNPLNAIEAAVAALELDFGDDPDASSLFHIVRTQVDRLARLMRDLLVIGKPVHEAWLQKRRASDVVSEAVIAWRAAHPELSRDRVALVVVRDCDVWVDAGRLQQVFVNLMDNAVQHSAPASEICVVVEGGTTSCRLLVRDYGSGIDPAVLPHIFDPFFTTRRGGTGLGLSLVRSIVEQHGGRVALSNNTPPPGCTAEVTLPVETTKEGRNAAEAADRR